MRFLPLLLLVLAALPAAAQGEKGEDETSAEVMHDGRFPVQIDGKWGYIDRTGAVVIAPAYDRAWPFQEGRGRVLQFGRFGFVDASGALAVPPRFDDAYDFSGGRARVVQYEAAYSERRGRTMPAGTKLYGYVGPDGQMATEPAYTQARDYGGGRAPVRLTTREPRFSLARMAGFSAPTWAALLPDGRAAFEVEHRDLGPFSEGLAPFSTLGWFVSRPQWGYLDEKGRTAIRPAFDQANGFSEGLACVWKDGLAGFVSTSGTFATPLQFSACGRFADGVAPVQEPATGRWGYVGTDGRWVTEPQFAYAGDVEEGVALVQAADERFGFFVPGEGFVLAPTYDWARPFDGGLAYVRQGTVEGYVDRTGAFVWQQPASTEEAEDGAAAEGEAAD